MARPTARPSPSGTAAGHCAPLRATAGGGGPADSDSFDSFGVLGLLSYPLVHYHCSVG
jgi:hypothetical protein